MNPGVTSSMPPLPPVGLIGAVTAKPDPRRLRYVALTWRSSQPAAAREVMHSAFSAASCDPALGDLAYQAADDWARWALQDRSPDLAEAVTERFAIHPCPATACAVADVARLVGPTVAEAFDRTISVLDPPSKLLCLIAAGDHCSALMQVMYAPEASNSGQFEPDEEPTTQALDAAEWAAFQVRQEATEARSTPATVRSLARMIDRCGVILRSPHDVMTCFSGSSILQKGACT
jgi:hypothetical protein